MKSFASSPAASLSLPFDGMRQVSWQDAPCAVPEALKKNHVLWKVEPPDGKSLFTGYFEPVLRGSLKKEGAFRFPLYTPPSDLVRVSEPDGQGKYRWGRMKDDQLSPHFSRAEVEAGALEGLGLELLFVEDEIDLFFLHIQGSGKIEFPDGFARRVTFAGKAGHPYTAIGKILREEEKLNPATMEDIKTWLRQHPERVREILNRNASFIYFRFLEGEGPVGASGDVLEVEQSLAVDDTIWPYGLDVIVETTDPLDPSQKFVRLMKTADTGSAIRGLVRGDIFFGSGPEAGKKAGAMATPGHLWIILPH